MIQTQEKTQELTQRRLEKAREDGDVLSSKEMFVFGSSVIGLLVLALMGLFLENLLSYWATFFIFSHPEELSRGSILNSVYGFKVILMGRQFLDCLFS